MSAKTIWLDTKTGEFSHYGTRFAAEQLGSEIARAILDRKKYIAFEADGPKVAPLNGYGRSNMFVLSVKYCQEMLQFAAKHGWFWDSLEDTVDGGAFDNTAVTPGSGWLAAQECFAGARALLRDANTLAREARGLDVSPRERQVLFTRARSLRREARQSLIAGHLRQMPGISKPPFPLSRAEQRNLLSPGQQVRRV